MFGKLVRHAQIDVGVVIELDRLRWIRVPLSHIVAVQQQPGVLREGIGSIEVDHGRSEALVEGRRLRSGGSRDVHQGRRAAQVDGSVRFGGGLQLEAPARRVRQRSGDEDRQARARIDLHAATADVVELAPEGRDGVADGRASVLQAAFRHVREGIRSVPVFVRLIRKRSVGVEGQKRTVRRTGAQERAA